MKGDFTRDTFEPLKHFSRVLMQQGRVQLDSDFNEQASILLHYLRTMMTDLIGPYGGPVGNRGFEIQSLGADKNDFSIGPGRYYVDGILCENDAVINFSEQEYLKSLAPEGKREFAPSAQGTYYVYLDVWERHITYVQNDLIREKALGGPDTCTRAKIVWQVKIHAVEKKEGSKIDKTQKKRIQAEVPAEMAATTDQPCGDAKIWIKNLLELSNTKIKARLQPISSEPDGCAVHTEPRYRGAENQLYRIEIHHEGPAGSATFKWSRDNGSVVFPIIEQKGAAVTLQSLGRDERTSLKVGDWVEIIDDDKELRGETGIMAEVEKADSSTMTVHLKSLDGNNWPDYYEKSTNHPLLRRWDQRVKKGIKLIEGAILITESNDPNVGWIEIEDGIEVQFQPGGPYRTGDYWLIPARVETGDIEWPSDNDGKEKSIPPHGIEHHYAPLAVLIEGTPTDCRCKFTVPCVAMGKK